MSNRIDQSTASASPILALTDAALPQANRLSPPWMIVSAGGHHAFAVGAADADHHHPLLAPVGFGQSFADIGTFAGTLKRVSPLLQVCLSRDQRVRQPKTKLRLNTTVIDASILRTRQRGWGNVLLLQGRFGLRFDSRCRHFRIRMSNGQKRHCDGRFVRGSHHDWHEFHN